MSQMTSVSPTQGQTSGQQQPDMAAFFQQMHRLLQQFQPGQPQNESAQDGLLRFTGRMECGHNGHIECVNWCPGGVTAAEEGVKATVAIAAIAKALGVDMTEEDKPIGQANSRGVEPAMARWVCQNLQTLHDSLPTYWRSSRNLIQEVIGRLRPFTARPSGQVPTQREMTAPITAQVQPVTLSQVDAARARLERLIGNDAEARSALDVLQLAAAGREETPQADQNVGRRQYVAGGGKKGKKKNKAQRRPAPVYTEYEG